jgi:hypothetical protein
MVPSWESEIISKICTSGAEDYENLPTLKILLGLIRIFKLTTN